MEPRAGQPPKTSEWAHRGSWVPWEFSCLDHHLKCAIRAGEVASLGKYSLFEHKDLNPIPKTQVKEKPGVVAQAIIPSTGEAESLGSLSSYHGLMNEPEVH